MKKSYVIGVDVSKLTLDAHCYGASNCMLVANATKGYRALLKWIKKLSQDLSEVMVVMEYCGVYTYSLEKFLHEHQLDYVKRSALDIKRSAGIKRGKTDRADARMISRYGWHRREELKPMNPVSQQQQQLQQLMAHRDKMVADRSSYQSRIKELHQHMKSDLSSIIIHSTECIMEMLEVEIKQIESQIKDLIRQEQQLQLNYELMTSVKGVGFVSAVHLLIATENFTRFTDVRKFACY